MVVPAFGSMVTFDPVGVIEEAMEETDRHAAILSISRNISYNLWPDECQTRGRLALRTGTTRSSPRCGTPRPLGCACATRVLVE